MALRDLMRPGKKKSDSDNEKVLALLASEHFPVVREAEFRRERYKKIPLTGLAALGAAFAQLPDAARTITTTVTSAVDLPQTLFVGVNQRGIDGFMRFNQNGTVGNIMHINDQGKQVIAGRMRFKPVSTVPVTQTTSTVVPLDPMMMVVAAALFNIDQKLDALQQKAEEILQFLQREKQSRQRGNLKMLADINEEFKREYQNEKMCALRVVAVQDIKRESYQDILFYQERIEDKLQEQQKLHVTQKSQEMLEKVSAEFYEYQLACYLFGFSTFMEVLLLKDFNDKHLTAVRHKIVECAEKYQTLYESCRSRVADYQRSALEVKLLGGLGKVAKTAGEKLAAVPILSKGPVDEALINAGQSLGRHNQNAVKRMLEQFEPLSDSRLPVFAENLATLNALNNHPEGLMTDGDSLYMMIG